MIAGVSVALVLIPQALAYADLAGMPAYHGLYAAILPPIAAAFFASSPYLQTGPVAITSVLTFGVLSTLAPAGSPEYVGLAALLALVVGVIRTVLGLVRFGWLAFLMSQPVLIGFTSAAALLIIISQVPVVAGVAPPDPGILRGAIWTLGHPAAWSIPAVAVAAAAVLIVLGSPRLHPLFPGVLVALGLGIAVGLLTDYPAPVVGAIQAHFPVALPTFPWSALPSLLVPGLVVAVVGFAEPAAIARSMAAQDRQRWSEDREFLSQGVANLAAALSGGFPVGGSFSRSGLNRLAGAKTRWSGAVAGVVVLLVLPFAAVLAPLPRAVLGAIVIASVYRLVLLRPLIGLRRYSPPQAAVGWVTFVATLVLAPRIDWAILLGIGLAVIVHLWRELSVAVKTQYEDGTLRLTPQGVLFFASAPLMHGRFLDELAAHPDAVRLEIDLRHLGRIDLTGAMALKELVEEAEGAGLTVELTEGPPQARQLIQAVIEG